MILQGELNLLQEDLEEYFGTLNEIRAGLATKPIAKPPELRLFEMLQETGLPMWSGGLMDQPHIWLYQYGLIKSVKAMFEAISQASQRRVEDGIQDNV